MSKRGKKTAHRILLRLLFLLYVAAMLWLLFGQRWGENTARAVNLTPFATLKLYWRILKNSHNTPLLLHSVVNLVGNVVMFVPLGFYAPYLLKSTRNFLRFLVLMAGTILAIELVQYATALGCLDVDDVILNMAGVLMGYFVWLCNR